MNAMMRRRATVAAWGAVAAATLLACEPLAARPAGDDGVLPSLPLAASREGEPSALSVLTYNVHGVPWPVASGRGAALTAIGDRLAAMRRAGTQPHIVAVQEAFTAQGRAIGAQAGYRYAAFGPDAEQPAPTGRPADRAFTASAGWWSGEREGKLVGSGLAIFSDYPIVAVRRVAYPVCAGRDCLANKGALAVLVRAPDGDLTVVDTHLNCNVEAAVPEPRTFYAFRRQLDTLAAFVARVTPAGTPLIVAGDFNVGANRPRQAYFARTLATDFAAVNVLAADVPRDRPLGFAVHRRKDWLLVPRDGSLRPLALGAAFGWNRDGAMLSDHVALDATFGLIADGAAPKVDRAPSAVASTPPSGRV